MKFQFEVHLNDQDYLDYNKFWMLRSHYGKKQMRSFRIMIAALLGVVILYFLFRGGFTAYSLVSILPTVIFLILLELALAPLFGFFLKGHLKSLKKKGKMGYAPDSVMEFYEDSFVETTPENKTEQKYSAIERISVVNNTTIYLHINNIMAYILPFSCFESKEQYDEFFEFITTKCGTVDRY